MWRNLWPLGSHFLSTSAPAVELLISVLPKLTLCTHLYPLELTTPLQFSLRGIPGLFTVSLPPPFCFAVTSHLPCGVSCLHCGEPVTGGESALPHGRDMLWLTDLYCLPDENPWEGDPHDATPVTTQGHTNQCKMCVCVCVCVCVLPFMQKWNSVKWLIHFVVSHWAQSKKLHFQ